MESKSGLWERVQKRLEVLKGRFGRTREVGVIRLDSVALQRAFQWAQSVEDELELEVQGRGVSQVTSGDAVCSGGCVYEEKTLELGAEEVSELVRRSSEMGDRE